MTRIIAFFNQKGGTAKTTSTLNVAAALAERGRNVLAVDLDPQASLTMATGIDVAKLPGSVYDLLVEDNYRSPGSFNRRSSRACRCCRPIPISPPPSLSCSTCWSANASSTTGSVKPTLRAYDYVLIDSPAGAQRDFDQHSGRQR